MRNALSFLPQRRLQRNTSPFNSLMQLENEMDRLMQSTLDWPEAISRQDFAPACNVEEDDKEYIVKFDIPGVKKDDVKIEVDENRLMVSGERRQEKEVNDSKRYISESFYGSFMRSLHLPMSAAEDKIDASYKDGVLTIKVPKKETSKAKKIKIH